MFNRLRELRDLKNIENTLKSCANSHSEFFLWYNENNERVKSESKILSVEFKKEIVAVFETQVITSKNIDTQIFLYHEQKQILFKGIVLNVEDEKVTISINPKIFMEEKRDRGRFYFKKIDVLVKVAALIKGKLQTFFVNLDNISEGGMCIVVPVEEKANYSTDMTIDLLKIEGIKLPEKIEGHIVHLTHSKSNDEEEVIKIGIQFKMSSPIIKEVMLVMGRN